MTNTNVVMEWITIYSQRMAGYLMLNGFVLMGIGENTKHKGMNVFYFKDSINLKQYINQFLLNYKY